MLVAMATSAHDTVSDLLHDALDAAESGRLSVAQRRVTAVERQATCPAHRCAAQVIAVHLLARRGDRAQACTQIAQLLPQVCRITTPDALLAEALLTAGLWWSDDGDEPSVAQRLLEPALAVAPSTDHTLRAAIAGALGTAMGAAGDPEAGRRVIRDTLNQLSGAPEKAALLGDLAMLEMHAERWREAVALHRQAFRQARRSGDADADALIQTQHGLGYSLLAHGQTAEAGRMAQACWRLVQRLCPDNQHWTWTVRRLLADQADLAGRGAEAVRHLRAALPAAEACAGPRSVLVAELRAELGELLMDRKPQEALAALEPAVAILSRERGPWHVDTRAALRCAARALDGAGQSDEAERHYVRLLEHTPREAADRATIAADLGSLLASQERYTEALPWMREAFHRFHNDPAFDPDDLAMFAVSFADVLCELGLEREMDMMWDLVEQADSPKRKARR